MLRLRRNARNMRVASKVPALKATCRAGTRGPICGGIQGFCGSHGGGMVRYGDSSCRGPPSSPSIFAPANRKIGRIWATSFHGVTRIDSLEPADGHPIFGTHPLPGPGCLVNVRNLRKSVLHLSAEARSPKLEEPSRAGSFIVRPVIPPASRASARCAFAGAGVSAEAWALAKVFMRSYRARRLRVVMR